MRCARALPILQLMPAASSRNLPVAARHRVDFPERLSGRTSLAARTPGTPSIIMSPDPSSVDPDKAGRRRAPTYLTFSNQEADMT